MILSALARMEVWAVAGFKLFSENKLKWSFNLIR